MVHATHTFLRSVWAVDLEEVFMIQQAEIRSPTGEAGELIETKRLSHTSMSVGDLIQDATGKIWAVAPVGFTELT
jgi:hypothetical protein